MAYMHVRQGWHQLKQNDRDRMEALLDAGETQRAIAKILRMHESTISRERKRQRISGRYDATVAAHKASILRGHSKYQGMKIEADPALRAYVIAGLTAQRSPDEIAGRMQRERQSFSLSKNAIYHWLYSAWGQQYCPLLCTRRYRKKQQRHKAARVMIPNRMSIDQRPHGATNKTRYGHYEGDTIVAPKRVHNTESIAIAVERKTKLLVGCKIPSLAPREMVRAMTAFEKEVVMKSVTLDNGIENKYHERWPMKAFFADRHSPWQKPLVECAIGLVRRWYFPKGTDWAQVSEAALQTAITMLNNKYRKSLGYQSAYEVAYAHGMMKATKKPPERSCN